MPPLCLAAILGHLANLCRQGLRVNPHGLLLIVLSGWRCQSGFLVPAIPDSHKVGHVIDRVMGETIDVLNLLREQTNRTRRLL